MKKRLQFYDELENPKTFFHAGKRCIEPYWHTFRCTTRGRWVGEPLVDVLQKEFPAFSPEFLDASMRAGRMKLNGKVIGVEDGDHVLTMKDIIEHEVHRHEPPVLATLPVFLDNLVEGSDLQGLYAVNKPPSLPVHPCGGYNFNSLIHVIMQPPISFPLPIQPVHRLDRLTSGVVIFSDNPDRSCSIFQEILDRTVLKFYVARVNGILGQPGDVIQVDAPLWSCPAGRNIGRVDEELGKPSSTIFTILGHHEDSTLVQCQPRTGRTHQIRIHLKHLGHPIVGDPLYQLQDPENEETNQFEYLKQNTKKPHADYLSDPSMSFNSPEYQPEEDPLCEKCRDKLPDMPVGQMYMCLHSTLYSGNGWRFYAEPPFWAEEVLPLQEIRQSIMNSFEDCLANPPSPYRSNPNSPRDRK